jgi:integrase/recombinase XerD
MRFIQQMLGRVSIGTTEIYTHVSIVKLKQIHEMTHPTLYRKPKP